MTSPPERFTNKPVVAHMNIINAISVQSKIRRYERFYSTNDLEEIKEYFLKNYRPISLLYYEPHNQNNDREVQTVNLGILSDEELGFCKQKSKFKNV